MISMTKLNQGHSTPIQIIIEAITVLLLTVIILFVQNELSYFDLDLKHSSKTPWSAINTSDMFSWCGGIASISIFHTDVWQGIYPPGYIPPIPLLVAWAEHESKPVSNVHVHKNLFSRDEMQVWGMSATANEDDSWRHPVFSWVSVSISSVETHQLPLSSNGNTATGRMTLAREELYSRGWGVVSKLWLTIARFPGIK